MGGFSRFDDFLSAMSPSCPGTPDGLAFIVKRNPRGESAGRWLEQAKGNSDGPSEAYRNDRKGADVSVWRGVVSHVKTETGTRKATSRPTAPNQSVMAAPTRQRRRNLHGFR